MSAEGPDKGEKTAVPEVPGVLRLAWMVFMQPVRLQRLFHVCGFDEGPRLFKWRDPISARVSRRLVAFALLATPAAVPANTMVATMIGAHVVVPGVVVGTIEGMVLGAIMIGGAWGLPAGITAAMASGIVTAMGLGNIWGDVSVATSAGAAFGLTLRVAQRAGTKFPIVDADLQNGLVGPVVAVTLALAGDRYVGIGIGAGYTLFYFHLPFYLCEAFAMAILLAMARTRPRASARHAAPVPFSRSHFLSSTRLRAFLVILGEQQVILRQLAAADGALGDREADARDLLHERLIERDGDAYRIAVPLFAAWIRERA